MVLSNTIYENQIVCKSLVNKSKNLDFRINQSKIETKKPHNYGMERNLKLLFKTF